MSLKGIKTISDRFVLFTAGENSIIIVGGANTAEWNLGEEASQVTALFSAHHEICHDTQLVVSSMDADCSQP